jgi:hypothetical protein
MRATGNKIESAAMAADFVHINSPFLMAMQVEQIFSVPPTTYAHSAACFFQLNAPLCAVA